MSLQEHMQPSSQAATASAALPKEAVLRGKRNIDLLFRHGRRESSQYMQIVFLVGADFQSIETQKSHSDKTSPGLTSRINVAQPTSSISCSLFAVSRRAAGVAVKRNFAKRRLREIYRHLRPELKGPVWVAFIPSYRWLRIDTRQQERELRKLLIRSKLIGFDDGNRRNMRKRP